MQIVKILICIKLCLSAEPQFVGFIKSKFKQISYQRKLLFVQKSERYFEEKEKKSLVSLTLILSLASFCFFLFSCQAIVLLR